MFIFFLELSEEYAIAINLKMKKKDLSIDYYSNLIALEIV